MAIQHLRSSTANKRPTPAAMSDGQLAINSNTASPGLFFKDSAGALIKIGPVHVGSTAPNASPAAGGETGNTVGEQWLDTSSSRYVFKIWDGTAWRTEDGEFVNSSGDTMTGALVMDNQQQIRFREATANGTNYIALQASASVASDKTITLPDVTGTVVTTGDTGSVTSTMILDGTIVDGDISATAEIAVSKLADGTARQLLQTDAAGTGVEWASNIDIPGTLDVTGAATLDSTLSVPLGSAGSPSIYPGTDTNTGIYSPGADQLAISTGGTGRLFVDASGNVGVGVSPSAWNADYRVLQLKGGGALSNDGGNTEVRFSQNAFVDSGSLNKYIASAAATRYRQTSGLHLWEYAASGTAGNTITFNEAARIRADGMFEVKGAGVAGSSPAFSVSGSAPGNSVLIDSNGRLGVGTTGPGHRLHVVSSGALSTIAIGDTAVGTYTNLLLYGGSGKYNWSLGAQYNVNNAFEITPSTATGGTTFSTPAFVVNSSGNVGIGTTSPGEKLTVNGTVGVESNLVARGPVEVLNSNYLYLYNTGSTTYWDLRNNANDLTFRFNGSEKARIDASGRLLVGATSNFGAGALQVFGGSVVTDNAAGGQNITVLSTNTGAANLGASIGLGGKNLSSQNIIYGAIAGRFEGTGNAGYLQFATTNSGGTMTEKIKISSAGLITCSNGADNMFVVNTAASGTSNYFFQGYSFTDLAPKIVLWNNGNVVNTNNSYGTLSDIKLKENIVDANSQWDDLKALRVRNFNLKAETGHETHTQIGLIAQEVELVSPGLVIESPDHDKDGNDLGTVTKSVSYSVLYMKAVKALQEAMERIETLEAKVAALEAQ